MHFLSEVPGENQITSEMTGKEDQPEEVLKKILTEVWKLVVMLKNWNCTDQIKTNVGL